ncbi:unnamed protein product [Durusdinium trenchii]|uniref:RNB domain-containing protein n=2 Tax=Durusdinium trenchii TaxID=1381693 RepID=A0ABP0I8A6_9DINO
MDLLQLDLADEFPDDSLGTSCLPESKDLCLCPLPWHELSTDADAHAFDLALFATEEASQRSERKEEWRRGLEEALAAEDNEALQCVLEQHGWSGQQFSKAPELGQLLEDLKRSSGLEEDCHESDSEGELSMPPMSNDMASSCAVTPNDLEGQMERQSAHVQSLKELMGMMVFGTFRVVSGVEAQKRCGEVTVERGPGLLHGCRVKIWGSKNRGRTWDYDRCYVRILSGRVSGASGRTSEHLADLQMERTELFGRVIHAEEFGVARQKRFICLKSKVVRNDRFVAFQPINGKLPAIQVPWNAARPLPNSRDLHFVEVQAWADRGPRGQYLEDLKMFHRNSNVSILEPVQISLNFCDWPRSNVREELSVPEFPTVTRRNIFEEGLTVGIQHPGLPTGMLMSCAEKQVHLHVLDVNAYLDAPGMAEVEALVRRRSVGVWFLDHLDKPLEANLPLFPPNIEEDLTFKPGEEKPAISFTFEAAGNEIEFRSVRETTVRCDRILTPAEAGTLILADEGSDVGQLLGRLRSYAVKFRQADLARESGSALEYVLLEKEDLPGPLLATEQLLQGCMAMVDRQVGATLTPCAWKHVTGTEEDEVAVAVRYLQGQADPSMRKVVERLLRLKVNERNKEIRLKEIMQTLQEILSQPGLSKVQKHACQSSFLRRLHAAIPSAYYEVTNLVDSAQPDSAADWWLCEPRFHVTLPLQRYIDILGMRAFKCQQGWTSAAALSPHLLLKQVDLEEAIARTNCRWAAQSFGLYIFRTISRMRELLGSGQRYSEAVIGAVGPKYLNVLIPSETTQILELKVPVSSLCSSSCISEYDPVTQSTKLTMQNGRDVDTLRISSWHAPRMSCVIARNFAQPIPHHASPNSIVVSEMKFHAQKDFVFAIGLKSFPESFSSWPDLSDWPQLDRKVEIYSQVWSRIKSCQVHAAAVASGDAYTPASRVSNIKWFQADGQWTFRCDVDVKLSESQWLQPGDLAVLTAERGAASAASRPDAAATLQGLVRSVRAAQRARATEAKDEGRRLCVEVELSKVAQLARDVQKPFLDVAEVWQLYFILVPSNEKKSIQLLQDMRKSPPLQGM